MAKPYYFENVYQIAFTERDKEIIELEYQRADIKEDLEDAIKEFAKLSRKRRLKGKRKKIIPLLQDAKNPDKFRLK